MSAYLILKVLDSIKRFFGSLKNFFTYTVFPCIKEKFVKNAVDSDYLLQQYLLEKRTIPCIFIQCPEPDDLKNGAYWMKEANKSKKYYWRIQEVYFCRKNTREWCKKNKNILKLKRKALSGEPKALYDYSEHLMHDSRTSLEVVHEWHTKAAKAGYPIAMGEEGDFIIYGWVQGTLEDAFNYYKKAYEAGYKRASRGLGDCYYYGWGTERSLEKAMVYYRIAKRFGIGINIKVLNKMTEEEFLKVDCEQALKKYREFYNFGDMRWLSRLKIDASKIPQGLFD